MTPTYGNTLMGLACPKPFDPADEYAITYYPPLPRAAIEIVDPDDLDRTVEYGERGRVLLYSAAYLTNRLVPVTRAGGPDIRDVQDLDGRTVADADLVGGDVANTHDVAQRLCFELGLAVCDCFHRVTPLHLAFLPGLLRCAV